MAHQEREWTINEPDEPNIKAVYIIIILSLLSLAISMYGLAEYKAHIDQKRQDDIQATTNENVQKKIDEKDAATLKKIDAIIEGKKAN